MKGHGFRNNIAENLTAMNPYLSVKNAMNTRKKLCWRCQKDKSPVGGHMKIQLSLCKFVCADCLAAIAAKKEVAAQRTGGLPAEPMVK